MPSADSIFIELYIAPILGSTGLSIVAVMIALGVLPELVRAIVSIGQLTASKLSKFYWFECACKMAESLEDRTGDFLTTVWIVISVLTYLSIFGITWHYAYRWQHGLATSEFKTMRNKEQARAQKAINVGYKVYYQNGRVVDYWDWSGRLRTVRLDSAKERIEHRVAVDLHGRSTWLRGKDLKNPEVFVIYYQ